MSAKHGLGRRSRVTLIKEKMARLPDGLTTQQIATRFGISSQSVLVWMGELGFDSTDPRGRAGRVWSRRRDREPGNDTTVQRKPEGL